MLLPRGVRVVVVLVLHPPFPSCHNVVSSFQHCLTQTMHSALYGTLCSETSRYRTCGSSVPRASCAVWDLSSVQH